MRDAASTSAVSTRCAGSGRVKETRRGGGQTAVVPELPEVESARQVIERSALDRVVADVDDADTYECRPHSPGEIRHALVGRRLTAAHRRGKLMWCDTSGVDGDAEPGPALGLHLGMAGRILVSGPAGGGDAGAVDEGGDDQGSSGGQGGGPGGASRGDRKPEWDRFTITFEDGGALRLFDKRRLGRVRLDPDLDALGPDAGEIDREEFRERIGRGDTAVKARLLDQSAIAGIGNLLADEVLWQASIDPRRSTKDLGPDELDELRRRLRASLRRAIQRGGVHTGDVIEHRHAGGHCPRCGTAMTRATVGGRTTWWCPTDQT